MSTPTLFNIAAEHRALAERLSDLDIDDQTALDTLNAETGLALQDKAVGIVAVARGLERFAESMRAEEIRIAQRRRAVENRAKRAIEYVRDAMRLAGIEKIDTPLFRLAIRDNPCAVDVWDEQQVPAEYMRQPPAVVDVAKVKAALQSGQDVPGCRLVRGTRLDVK